MALAFRVLHSESWARPFFSRCTLVWEVQGTVPTAGRVGHEIPKPLNSPHCQDWHNSKWHSAGEPRSVPVLQAFPYWLTRGEGLLGPHNWKCYKLPGTQLLSSSALYWTFSAPVPNMLSYSSLEYFPAYSIQVLRLVMVSYNLSTLLIVSNGSGCFDWAVISFL